MPVASKEKYKGPKVTDKESFVTKARWLHGDRYGYEHVEYITTNRKVCIICKEHGAFWQVPNSHLSGNGCMSCAKILVGDKYRKPFSNFVEDAKSIHGDKYDYSKVDYKKAHKKVVITCKLHGDFNQTPHNHLYGNGCPACADKVRADKTRKDTEWFISRAKDVHGGRYCYEVSDYIKSSVEVAVVCSSHGTFWITPNRHLSGGGCVACANEATGRRCRMTTKDFISKSRSVHGDQFDYSAVDCGRSSDKVEIICRIHGSFFQSARGHLDGHGCVRCSRKTGSNVGLSPYYKTRGPSNLYVALLNNSFIKVGVSVDLKKRMTTLKRESGCTVELLHSISGVACELFELEHELIRSSGLDRYHTEVDFSGSTECLQVSEFEKVVEIINSYQQTVKEDSA